MKKLPPWFKCYPRDLLHALAEHSSSTGYVYVLTLLLMYEKDGPIRRDDKAMAIRARMKPADVARAYRELRDARRLHFRRGMISNPRTQAEISERKQIVAKKGDAARKMWAAKKAAISKAADAPALHVQSTTHESQSQSQSQSQKERKLGAAYKGNGRGISARMFFDKNVTLPDTFKAEAKRIGLSEPDAERQWDRFRDWHLARGTVHVDWLATFRTWGRKFLDGFPGRPSGGSGKARFI